MSLNFDNIQPVQGAAPAARPGAVAGRPPAHGVDPAVTVDIIGASPPPEVHDQVAVAAGAADRLAAENRQLSFKVDHRSGKVHVEVRDLHGRLLFTAPGSKALDIAAGGSAG